MDFLRQVMVGWAPFHQSFPSPTRAMTYEIDRRVAVDRRRRFIYFRIPKAANSTVAATLFPSKEREVSAHTAKRAFARASDLSRQEVAELERRFFLFTVVRDPYARLASAYLHKVSNGVKGRRQVVENYRCANPEKVSFVEFCRFLAQGGRDLNPHWYRQVDLIPCGFERLHYVGRVESLDEALAQIAERLDGRLEGRVRSVQVHGTNAVGKLRGLYCAETMAIIRQLYAADFTAFDYTREPDWAQGLVY